MFRCLSKLSRFYHTSSAQHPLRLPNPSSPTKVLILEDTGASHLPHLAMPESPVLTYSPIEQLSFSESTAKSPYRFNVYHINFNHPLGAQIHSAMTHASNIPHRFSPRRARHRHCSLAGLNSEPEWPNDVVMCGYAPLSFFKRRCSRRGLICTFNCGWAKGETRLGA
ncbi:hypothetical protein VTG60DRAFT_2242 [Thermothelomyces hinnuleus]